jgi:hypothetical protein
MHIEVSKRSLPAVRGLLAERIIGHRVRRFPCNLLTVVAGLQPGMVVAGLANIVVAADFRFG